MITRFGHVVRNEGICRHVFQLHRHAVLTNGRLDVKDVQDGRKVDKGRGHVEIAARTDSRESDEWL